MAEVRKVRWFRDIRVEVRVERWFRDIRIKVRVESREIV